jgi:hypothetical protein
MFYPSPGLLPTKRAPAPGESIDIRLEGLPSYKEIKRSIRNPIHPRFDAFTKLREAATVAMAGRECYSGPIRMDFVLYAPSLQKPLLDYAAGIEDTLDGSHGPSFTYLPIVYQDDCQICDSRFQFIQSPEMYYTLRITFLPTDATPSAKPGIA